MFLAMELADQGTVGAVAHRRVSAAICMAACSALVHNSMQLGAMPPAGGLESQWPAGGAGLGGTQGSLPRALRRAGIPARHGQHRAP